MGFMGFMSPETDASQNYYDKRAAAAEQGTLAYGEYAMALGIGASSNRATGSGVSTSGAPIVLGGKGGNASYSYSTVTNDPNVAIVALRQNKKLADSFLSAMKLKDETLADVLAEQQDSMGASQDKTNALLASLAESKQTEGESGRNKIVLYVVLATLALVGWIFWRK
jgi:hypothetical protein